jgi:hypothetical protein
MVAAVEAVRADQLTRPKNVIPARSRVSIASEKRIKAAKMVAIKETNVPASASQFRPSGPEKRSPRKNF